MESIINVVVIFNNIRLKILKIKIYDKDLLYMECVAGFNIINATLYCV